MTNLKKYLISRICLIALLAMAAITAVPAAAMADPSMDGDEVLIEGHTINRYDEGASSNYWDQDTNDGVQYGCGWSSSIRAVCVDHRDSAVYFCDYLHSRIWCWHHSGGAAQTANARQTSANTLARGIGNRGQVPRYQTTAC